MNRVRHTSRLGVYGTKLIAMNGACHDPVDNTAVNNAIHIFAELNSIRTSYFQVEMWDTTDPDSEWTVVTHNPFSAHW